MQKPTPKLARGGVGIWLKNWLVIITIYPSFRIERVIKGN